MQEAEADLTGLCTAAAFHMTLKSSSCMQGRISAMDGPRRASDLDRPAPYSASSSRKSGPVSRVPYMQAASTLCQFKPFCMHDVDDAYEALAPRANAEMILDTLGSGYQIRCVTANGWANRRGHLV